MKSLLHLFLLAVTIASSAIFVSCEPEEYTDTDPSDPRNSYVGVWRFTEDGKLKNGLSQSYIVTITLDQANSSQIILDNFGNPGDSDKSVTGIVTTNQVVVSPQSLSNGWLVEGSGKLSSATSMNWSYSITVGGDKEYYTATATKQ